MPGWSFRSWLRGNALALVVMVVAGAALVGVVLGLPLAQNASLQDEPVEVAKNQRISVSGYSWTLVASGEFPHSPDNDEVPEGLAVTAAVIQVRPLDVPGGPLRGYADGQNEPSGTCNAELTTGHGPESPRWLTIGDPYKFNYGVLDESTTVCLLEGEPFDLEVVFLAPEGTIDDAVVEVEIGGIGGKLVRFALTD